MLCTLWSTILGSTSTPTHARRASAHSATPFPAAVHPPPPPSQTVCYIVPVNAAILSDTGGTCDPAVECDVGGPWGKGRGGGQGEGVASAADLGK